MLEADGRSVRVPDDDVGVPLIHECAIRGRIPLSQLETLEVIGQILATVRQRQHSQAVDLVVIGGEERIVEIQR